jgi:hypothetical protein
LGKRHRSWLLQATTTDLLIVKNFSKEQWVWVVTIAGVFLALTRLDSLDLENSRKERILEVVKQKLAAWKSDGDAGFQDCRAFVDKTHDRLAMTDEYKSNIRLLASDCLGSWMAWNLLGHTPESEAERNLLRMAGGFVAAVFFDWWQQT